MTSSQAFSSARTSSLALAPRGRANILEFANVPGLRIARSLDPTQTTRGKCASEPLDPRPELHLPCATKPSWVRDQLRDSSCSQAMGYRYPSSEFLGQGAA